jgi:hypothetical protein
MIIAAVRALLLADTQIAAALGTRVYAVEMPQKTQLPAAMLTLVAGVPGQTMDSTDGLTQSRLELAVWSSTAAQAASIADRARRVLAGFSGTASWATAPAGSLVIDSFDFTIGEQDDFSDDLRLFCRRIEFYAWHAHGLPLGQE